MYPKSYVRELNGHKVNDANDTLTVTVLDEPGAGGANHVYHVGDFDNDKDGKVDLTISFQNGPIKGPAGGEGNDNGVNGVTHEVLLEIVADRLRSFQKGSYACKANACALTHIEEAQHWLQQRTLERMRRGVEGTHTI